MTTTEENVLRHHLNDCIGKALDMMGNEINGLSCFCTLEEGYSSTKQYIKSRKATK